MCTANMIFCLLTASNALSVQGFTFQDKNCKSVYSRSWNFSLMLERGIIVKWSLVVLLVALEISNRNFWPRVSMVRSLELLRPWKCALPWPRTACKLGIQPFVYHRLCTYTCVHTQAWHNQQDCPYRFCTIQNHSWILCLKWK